MGLPHLRARLDGSGGMQELARCCTTLQTWPWLDTVRTLRQRFREDHLGLTAGSLTFTTLISLVPLVTVMLAVFSAFPMFSAFQGSLQKYFLQSLVPDSIAKPVLGALTQFAGKANRLGTVGLVLLLLAALALMLTIDRTLNASGACAAAADRAARARLLGGATLGPLLLGVSLTLTSYVISASRGIVVGLPGGVSLLLNTIEFVLLAARHGGAVPLRAQHARALAPRAGRRACSSRWVSRSPSGLGWYLEVRCRPIAMVYGAFATLPIFLVWIYLGWVIVLLGAVIAAYTPSLQMRVTRWPDGPGSRFSLAVALLAELDRARRGEERGLSLVELSERLRVDPLQAEPIVDALVELDWLARLDEAGAARYVLLCDPVATPAAPMLAQMLLEPLPSMRGFRERIGFDRLTLADLLQG
jgi:membrane protein